MSTCFTVPGGRPIFLAILVAFSTIGVSALGVTPVAATEPIDLEDGEDYIYHGQTVRIDVAERFDVDDGDELYVYELEDDDIDSVADRPTVEGGTITIDTDEVDDDDGPQFALTADSGLDGTVVEYTIDPQEIDAAWNRETATSSDDAVELEIDSNRGSEYNVTISADEFEYDDLRTAFLHNDTDVEEVTDPAHLPLDRLDYDRDAGDGVEDMRADDYLTLNLADSDDFSDDGTIDANFMALEETRGLPDDGEYEFDVTVTDTSADDSSTIEIGETGATFEEDRYARAAGDLAEFTVDLEATDEAWLLFGDEADGFVDVLYVEDDDGSGDVTFTANTRLIGTDHSRIDGVEPDDADIVYDSEDDVVESYIHDEVVGTDDTDVGDASFYAEPDVEGAETIPFETYLEELDILDGDEGPTEQLERPLQPTVYELSVERGQNFVVEDGEASADDAIGSTELTLFQPSVGDATTAVAPADDADDTTTIAALDGQLTDSETVAIGDRAVVGFNATGLSGAMATIDYVENGNDILEGTTDGFSANVLHELARGETDWTGEGVTFALEGPDIPNQESNTVPLEGVSSEEVAVLVAVQESPDDRGKLYVVVDTDDEPFVEPLEDGDVFDAELAYDGGDERYRFDDPAGVFGGEDGDVTTPAHPYTLPKTTDNATTSPTFEAPTVTFDRTTNEIVQIPPEESAPVSGDTNVAPETTVTVTVRDQPADEAPADEEPPFLVREDATVDENGTIDAQLDLSDRSVSDRAIVEVALRGETIATADVIFTTIEEDRPAFFDATLETPDTVEPGESFEVNATVRNTGDERGTAALRTSAGGDVLVDDGIELEANGTTESTETVEAGSESDSIDVTVSTQHVAATSTVTVGDDETARSSDGATARDDETRIVDLEPATETDSDDEESVTLEGESDGLSGFGSFGAMLAVLVGTGVVYRRYC